MKLITDVVDSFANDETISIKLDCGNEYTVSKALLCGSSDYFKKALEGAFSESETRELALPDCKEETFQLFLYYLVEKRLPKFAMSDFGLSYDNGDTVFDSRALARLWVFADYLVFPKLQDAAMGCMLSSFGGGVDFKLIEYVYANSTKGSPLRMVFVAEAATEFLEGTLMPDEEQKIFERLAMVSGHFLDVANCFRNYLKTNGRWIAPSDRKNDSEYMVGEKGID